MEVNFLPTPQIPHVVYLDCGASAKARPNREAKRSYTFTIHNNHKTTARKLGFLVVFHAISGWLDLIVSGAISDLRHILHSIPGGAFSLGLSLDVSHGHGPLSIV